MEDGKSLYLGSHFCIFYDSSWERFFCRKDFRVRYIYILIFFSFDSSREKTKKNSNLSLSQDLPNQRDRLEVRKYFFLLRLYLRTHNVSYVKQQSGKRSKARTSLSRFSINFKTFFSIWFAVKIPESKHVLLGFKRCNCVVDTEPRTIVLTMLTHRVNPLCCNRPCFQTKSACFAL